MKRKPTVAVSAVIIVLGLALIPGRAEARHGAGAFFGGLAAGAILGGVLAAPYAYPAPFYGPAYYGGPTATTQAVAFTASERCGMASVGIVSVS
jgi:hypothetical protein